MGIIHSNCIIIQWQKAVIGEISHTVITDNSQYEYIGSIKNSALILQLAKYYLAVVDGHFII